MSVLDAVEDVKSRSGTPDEVPTVPTSSNPEENVCPICHEEFDQFYKQDFADSSSSTGKWGVGKFRINALTPPLPPSYRLKY